MDGNQIETQNLSAVEEIKLQGRKTLTSQLGLIPESVILPPQLKRVPIAGERDDDVLFRKQVEQVLPDILPGDGKLLIIENIATQHAVATTPVYLTHNIDSYFTFIPEETDIRPVSMRGSYYHPERVLDVVLANQETINNMKAKIEPNTLKGIRVVMDPHASFELEAGLFNRFFPSEEKLQELGVKKIVMIGEFPPENARGLIERRVNKKEEWDKSPIYEYLRTMKARGYEISLRGVDTRTN